jgi:hypothetical protein
LQRVFSVDLLDVWRGTLSLRRLRVLVEALPADSATAYALTGASGPLTAWSLTDVLLGRVTDELAALRWQWESSHLPKGKSPRKPPESVLPLDEPTPDPASVPIVSPHRLHDFLHDDERSA